MNWVHCSQANYVQTLGQVQAAKIQVYMRRVLEFLKQVYRMDGRLGALAGCH